MAYKYYFLTTSRHHTFDMKTNLIRTAVVRRVGIDTIEPS